MNDKDLDIKIQQGIETYMRNKQFNYSKIPSHEHNGVDTVKISQKNIILNNKVVTGIVANTTEVDVINSIPNISKITFLGFAANNSNPGTALFTNGSTTVTGTGTNFYAGMVGQYIVTPVGNAQIGGYVSATQITLSVAYPGATTLSIAYSIPATKRAIINGIAEIGNCYNYSDVTSTIPTGTNILQICNYMYVDSGTLANNRVGTASPFFCYATDESNTILVQTVVTYTNSIVTFTTTLAAGWKLQGDIILT